ncbi:hypothetical protein MJD09_20320, partial [bacterium]|nr:hypothetical protein [bacterium]
MRTYRFRPLQILPVLLFSSLLSASTPKILTYHSQKDFEKGQAKGVSINSLGEIRLAPAITEVFAPEIPFIWATVLDRQKNLFLAGGSSGEVYRVDSRSNSSSYFSSPGQQIYALSVDAQNNLFVATSPDGKVYKVPSGGGADPTGDVVF